jgi:hypothetical protein
MSEENEEYEEEVEDDGYEYCYGVAMPQLPAGLQPLEIIVLLEGIDMNTGQPTITAMGSDGMKPWSAIGLLRMEAARLEQGYIYGGSGVGFFDDDEEEEDDE